MRAGRALVLVLPLAFAACGPIPVDRAEEACFEDARLAAGPRGFVGLGAGSGGVSGKFSITVTSDYIQGRDPAEVYEACVFNKSGQLPRRPLYDRPDWKG